MAKSLSAAGPAKHLNPHCVSLTPGTASNLVMVLYTLPMMWRRRGSLKRRAPARLPRTQSHVVVDETGRQEAFQLLYGHGKVRVADEPVLGLGVKHAGSYRPALAGVGNGQQRDAGMAGCEVGDEAGGAITAAVVDDKNLPGVVLGLQVSSDPFQG